MSISNMLLHIIICVEREIEIGGILPIYYNP